MIRGVALTCAALLSALPLGSQLRGQAGQASVGQTNVLKAPNPKESDEFGFTVAISADGATMAVGAPREDGASAGPTEDRKDLSKDDAGAVYIFVRTGDRWVQQALIRASHPDGFDEFGNALAISGDGNTLVVGAYFEDSAAKGVDGNQADNSMLQAGAAYVFARRGTTWSQQAYLKSSNTGEQDDGDQFGYSVAISGDGNTIAVGAPTEDSNAPGVNGSEEDNSTTSAGAVYVFARSGNTWSQQAYMKSDRPRGGDLFGYSVALNGDGKTLTIGVYDEAGASREINGPLDFAAPGTGAVYVFARNDMGWAKEAYIKAKEGDLQDSFGCWVALSDDGNTLAVGAFDEDTLEGSVNAVKAGHSGKVDAPDDNSAGAAYVFTRNGTRWNQNASFKASSPGKGDWFGARLSLSGDGNTFAVSALNEDSRATGIDGDQRDDSATEAGTVYLFRRMGAIWAQLAYVKPSDTEAFDEFGSAVALNRDGSLLIVGARFQDDAATDSGAAYVFSIR